MKNKIKAVAKGKKHDNPHAQNKKAKADQLREMEERLKRESVMHQRTDAPSAREKDK